jgi:hypothetical protein
LAISERSEIDEAVTDVLVDRGNSEVARKVAIMRFWQVRSTVTPGTLPPMPA